MDRKSEEGAHGEPWAVREWAVGGCVFTERAGDRGVPAKLPGVERLADCLRERQRQGAPRLPCHGGSLQLCMRLLHPSIPGVASPHLLQASHLPGCPPPRGADSHGPSGDREWAGGGLRAGKLSRSHGYTPSVCPVQGAEPESSSRRVECQELGQLAWSCPLGVHRGRESLLSSGPAVGHAPSVSTHPLFVS